MVFPKEPETYYLDPTPYVPNSKLPVLIYRNCLGESPTAASLKTQIEPNRWLKGGQWKAYLTAHYHSITHECYAVFAGRSDILLGRSPVDDKDVPGVKVELGKGDIIVLPAGVSHHSVGDYTDDYEYCGFYPEGSPKWDNNWCKADSEETQQKAQNARSVSVPDFDPIFGMDGYLPQIWRAAISN